MSLAGIRSSRGDAYQVYIAIDWAIRVLSDPEYLSVENDSLRFAVDDVVVAKKDGSIICCQCKKNHKDFAPWSISDLADDLEKAIKVLNDNKQCSVVFYSRSNFGLFDKLKERGESYEDESQFISELTSELKPINDYLISMIASQNSSITTLEVLRRTSFVVTSGFKELELQLIERLNGVVSNSASAYNVLWRVMDQLGARVNGLKQSSFDQHRLTKDDLKRALVEAGAMMAPNINASEIKSSFDEISAIGRSWQRDIGGLRIQNHAIEKLLSAIGAGNRSILLKGLPGSGKTCVLLSLQEELEKISKVQADIFPLFIQAREYAALNSVSERQAIGLPDQWVEHAARLSESFKVVVIIDSLDVVSIARERSILAYFMAQIDRLLLIPNITIVAACREFDQKYDRRLASRKWDNEILCEPLNFDTQVGPLLEALGVDQKGIDLHTRSLIANPRELALFVELAKREGAFNVVTSQSLAKHYLESIVLSDSSLGDAAMSSIIDLAEKMLRARSLSIPPRHFCASQELLRRLNSLNILQFAHDGNLIFGHQTLLDAVVIYSAMKRDCKLSAFVQSLPPVPFVRPFIRLFVEQLAAGERREFRKQLRTVLFSNAAFHIRRLIAEVFSSIPVEDGDWPLVRDIYVYHHEIFLVIYNRAAAVDWCFFWHKYLVPFLIERRDSQGLIRHLYRVSLWKNEATETVLQFWDSSIDLLRNDLNSISDALGRGIADLEPDALPGAVPLLEKLLKLPVPEFSSIGRAIARSVVHCAADDRLLWEFISGDIDDEFAKSYSYEERLRCKPYELTDSSEDFLTDRFKNSTLLLDLAVDSIEHWSKIRASRFQECIGLHSNQFLDETSFSRIHSHGDYRSRVMRILFGAIEDAILYHSEVESLWWKENRLKLATNFEDSLRYFAVLAFTRNPALNVESIKVLLSDCEVFESDLYDEIRQLIGSSFHLLESDVQDSVIKFVAESWKDFESSSGGDSLRERRRVGYFSAIPCYLRPEEVQLIVDSYQIRFGELRKESFVRQGGGLVRPPFSFEVFLSVSNAGVIRILKYYETYERDFQDFLIGGKEEVAGQLREASSNDPFRFLRLMGGDFQSIAPLFRNTILDGVVQNVARRSGSQSSLGNVIQIEVEDAKNLTELILDELENHYSYWSLNSSAADALGAISLIGEGCVDLCRLVKLMECFVERFNDPDAESLSEDLISSGINSKYGKVAEALMALANSAFDSGVAVPELLKACLRRCVNSKNKMINALILRRLAYIQSKDPVLGWELFDLVMADSRVWQYSESCLYYAFRNEYARIAGVLELFSKSGREDLLETWGRISALSAFAGKIDFDKFVNSLLLFETPGAWIGAAGVWTHIGNIRSQRVQCIAGMEAGLKSGGCTSIAVAREMAEVFRAIESPVFLPEDLICMMFDVLESDASANRSGLFGFDRWLNVFSDRDPMAALLLLERYVSYLKIDREYFYDHENRLVQLLTRLFSDAEEREDSDQGAMLLRVVALQDKLFSLGLHSIDKWLNEAER